MLSGLSVLSALPVFPVFFVFSVMRGFPLQEVGSVRAGKPPCTAEAGTAGPMTRFRA
jgi:hypothetical protein